MHVIGVHADVLITQAEIIDRSRDLVGEGQRAVAYAAHGRAVAALTPTAAVTGLHRDALFAGVLLEVPDGVVNNELPEARIGNAELRTATRAVREGQVFRMGFEVGVANRRFSFPSFSTTTVSLVFAGSPRRHEGLHPARMATRTVHHSTDFCAF